MNQKHFGFYFADLREKSGYKSQRQLAEVSGVSNGSIARIEAGTQQPTPTTLMKLSKHLKDVTYEDLLEAAGYLENQDGQNTSSKQDEEINTAFNDYDNLTEEEKEYLETQLEIFRKIKEGKKTKERNEEKK